MKRGHVKIPAQKLGPAEFRTRLRSFPHIAVIGAQRSGTGVCAHMICHDLQGDGECEYRNWRDWPLDGWSVSKFLTRPRVVWHHPSLASGAIYAINREDVAVVFVRRSLADALASQVRVKWKSHEDERALLCIPGTDYCPSARKAALWARIWQYTVYNAFEVQYEDLAAHELWVPREQRHGWRVDQYGPEGTDNQEHRP